MADTLTVEQRKRCMSQVQSKNTKPEITVRKALRSLGFSYKIYNSKLPGKPDLVFPKLKRVVFVHGCFWHDHYCRKNKKMPVTNAVYWKKKIQRNKIRDVQNKKNLKKLGWETLVVWECNLKKPASLNKKLTAFLSD